MTEKYFCDRCGKSLGAYKSRGLPAILVRAAALGSQNYYKLLDDFCAECASKLKKMTDEFLNVKEIQQ